VPDNRPVAGTLEQIQPLEIEQVRRGEGGSLCNGLMEQYHYLEYEHPVGGTSEVSGHCAWPGGRVSGLALSQTDGDEYTPVTTPNWSEARALNTLGLTHTTFTVLNGNVQGYAQGRHIAINPVAALPHKTLIREIANILLVHCFQPNLPLRWVGTQPSPRRAKLQ